MKKCPYCNEEIQDDAVKCRFCGEWLKKEEPKDIAAGSLKFPKILPGYLLAALFLIFEIGEMILFPEASRLPITWWTILFSIIGVVYWCICVFRIHKNLLVMTDNHYPISPARAVGFGFIPFYNLYWLFKWPAEIISFVNSRDTSRKLSTWLPGLLLLLALIAFRIDGTFGFLLEFGVLSYLIRALKRSIGAHPQASPYKDRPTQLSAGVVVAIVFLCTIPVIAILAAIAIPNFISAKGRAMTYGCIANLKQIESAKQMWVFDTGAAETAAPEWTDLAGVYLAEKPTCPAGGTYTIGNINEPATCSIGNNNTVRATDDHIISNE